VSICGNQSRPGRDPAPFELGLDPAYITEVGRLDDLPPPDGSLTPTADPW
jgi:hypothetical protein